MYMHHRAQSDIVKRRAFDERLYAMKSQYYHWYATDFNVLADIIIIMFIRVHKSNSRNIQTYE